MSESSRRRRVGLVCAVIGVVLLAVPVLAFHYGRMIALALGGSLDALAGVLDLPVGGWEGMIPPEVLGGLLISASLLLLALPGLVLVGLGVAFLRRA